MAQASTGMSTSPSGRPNIFQYSFPKKWMIMGYQNFPIQISVLLDRKPSIHFSANPYPIDPSQTVLPTSQPSICTIKS
jgi:hypothetical protein